MIILDLTSLSPGHNHAGANVAQVAATRPINELDPLVPRRPVHSRPQVLPPAPPAVVVIASFARHPEGRPAF